MQIELKEIYKTCDIPIYKTKLALYITDDFKKIQKYYKVEFEDNEDFYACTFHTKDKDELNVYLIAINYDISKELLTHGMIAHEIFHVNNMIMDRIDMEPCNNNDECSAYLVEWLTNKVYGWIYG